MVAQKVILPIAHLLHLGHLERRFYGREDGGAQDEEERVEGDEKRQAKVASSHLDESRAIGRRSRSAHHLRPLEPAQIQ